MPLFFVAGSRAVVIILLLIYIKLYTNALAINELGYYAYWLALSYFFNALIFVPFDNYLQSRLHVWKEEGVSLRGAINFNNFLVLACFAAILVFSSSAYMFHSRDAALGLLVSLSYGLALHISNLSRNTTNNLNHRMLASFFPIVDGGLKIAVLLLAKLFIQVNGIVVIACALLSSAISSAICLSLMWRRGVFFSGRTEPVNVREAFNFSSPISVAAVFNWLQLQGYRLVLVPMGYAEAVGVYATISGIGAAAMNAVGSIYSQMRMPEIYRSRGRSITSYLVGIVILGALIGIAAWLFSDLIISLLANKELARHSGVIVFGVIIEGGNLIIGALGVAHSLNRPTLTLAKAGAAGLACCALGFTLLFKWIDVTNIGWPLALSQILVAATLWYVVRKGGWIHRGKEMDR